MSYLADYNALEPAEKRQRFSHLIQHKRNPFFAELRAQQPIFEIPGYEQGQGAPDSAVLVLKEHHIRRILDDRRFTIQPYQNDAHDAPPFALQMERGPRHDNARALIQHICKKTDARRIQELVEQESKTIIDAALPTGSIDLPSMYSRRIPLHILARYFGLPGPDPESMGTWTLGLFRWFMYNAMTKYLAPVSPEAEADMNTDESNYRMRLGLYLKDLLGEVQHALEKGMGTTQNTVITRLLISHEQSAPLLSSPLEYGVILAGLANAAIDQVNMAVCNTLHVLLTHSDPDVLKGAVFAAKSNNIDSLNQYIREALRFDPPIPFLARTYIGDAPYEFQDLDSSCHLATIQPGTRVFVALGSGMMDEAAVSNPEIFDPRRLDDPDLCFGTTPRECLGRPLAEAQIAAMVKPLLCLDGLRAESSLQKEELFLPKQFRISFDPKSTPKPVQSALTLVLKIKEPVAVNARILKTIIHKIGPEVAKNLNKVGTVHFARFVFLENDTRFGIITTFDGSFEVYINDFIEQVGPLFNVTNQYIEGAPPSPVQHYRTELIEFVRRFNVEPEVPLYSAYPSLTVQNIWYQNQKLEQSVARTTQAQDQEGH